VNLIFFAVCAGYLLGSLPAAFLLVRWQSRVDLRTAGSGNVGALNSFEVTRSRLVGVSVLVIDLVKGVAAVLAGRWIGGDASLPAMAAALAAVAGHNFPVWLRFRGGRGLATAAGAALLLMWGLVPLWCVLWAIAFSAIRSVNPASAVACVVSPAIVFLLGPLMPGVPPESGALYSWFAAVLMAVISTRLIGPTMTYLHEQHTRRQEK
jgi:acyl phosphate:glycerol-3-phosphate acyltransferase